MRESINGMFAESARNPSIRLTRCVLLGILLATWMEHLSLSLLLALFPFSDFATEIKRTSEAESTYYYLIMSTTFLQAKLKTC